MGSMWEEKRAEDGNGRYNAKNEIYLDVHYDYYI